MILARRWRFLTLVLFLLAAACGGKRVADPHAVWSPDTDGGIVLTFELDVEEARRRGIECPPERNALLLEETTSVVDQRLDHLEVPHRLLRLEGLKFEVVIPLKEETRSAEVVSVLAQRGDLQFRIEVLTDEQYVTRAQDPYDPGPDDIPKRKGVWGGTAEDLRRFKADEIARWRLQQQSGAPYTPSQPAYRLVKERGSDGSLEQHFHLVEEVNLPYPFGGGILEDAVATQDYRSEPVVVFDIKQEYQRVFGQWTESNRKLPLAIILNDEYLSAPTINEKLTRNVQITLGSHGSLRERDKEAGALAAALSHPAPMRVVPKLVSRDRLEPKKR